MLIGSEPPRCQAPFSSGGDMPRLGTSAARDDAFFKNGPYLRSELTPPPLKRYAGNNVEAR
jgi:hypothetical protein